MRRVPFLGEIKSNLFKDVPSAGRMLEIEQEVRERVSFQGEEEVEGGRGRYFYREERG